MSTEPVAHDEGRMTLIEHLTELRGRLIKCVIAVALGMIVGFVFYPEIFDLLIDPYCDTVRLPNGERCTLIQTEPTEGFAVRMRVSGYAGLAIAMPILLWQIWRFVTPGLYPHEKKYAVPFVVSALFLFLLGAGLAYWTLPQALGFLADIGGGDLQQFYRPAPYLRLVTYMMLAFGIGFEFPILLVFLQLAGIIEPDSLRRARRYAVVGICVLVAVITPSGDPISMLALSMPMVVFYEVAIIIGRVVAKRRAAAT